ncbi:MAG: integration host factor subunit beta [Betaproteobacteria bacterium]
MKKSDLIARLDGRVQGLQPNDAHLAVKLICDAMARALREGGRIEIRGFGSFGLTHRPARLNRNPRTGERVQVPAKCVPHFKTGKDLRETLVRQGVTPRQRVPASFSPP